MYKMYIKFFDVLSLQSLKHDSGVISLSLDSTTNILIKKRLDIISLDELIVDIKYKKKNKTTLNTRYELNIVGKQKCVVTLKALDFKIEKKFNMNFININKSDLKKLDDEYLEPIINNQVNLGEVALQMISLFLDPYPKSKSFNNIIENYNNKEEKHSINNNNMFELLNNLKK